MSDVSPRWLAARSIAVLMAGVVTLTGATISPAQSEYLDRDGPAWPDGPWWEGVIRTDISYRLEWATTDEPNHDEPVQVVERNEAATYSDLVPSAPETDGLTYAGHIAASGSEVHDRYEGCWDGSDYRSEVRWSVEDDVMPWINADGTVNEEYDEFFALVRDDEDPARVSFRPHIFQVFEPKPSIRVTCSSGSRDYTETLDWVDVLMWEYDYWEGTAYSGPPALLPDGDPDPLHLVGERTWTHDDPPYPLHMDRREQFEEEPGDGYFDIDYSFTVTYDLRLVNFSFQPDGWIGLLRPDGYVFRGYVGSDVYNATGKRQTKGVKVKRGRSKVFFISAENDGDIDDGLKVKGCKSARGYKVTYLAGARGSTEITKAVVAGTYHLENVAPGSWKMFRVILKVGPKARLGASRSCLVMLTSTSDATKKDAVKAKVTVKR